MAQSHFGEQFARIRGARHLSQEGLARRAGLSRATIFKAEHSRECELKADTVIMIIQALIDARPPLTPQEMHWLADQAGVDRRMLPNLEDMPAAPASVPAAPPPSTAEIRSRLHGLLDSVIAFGGEHAAHAALQALAVAFTPTDAADEPRSVRVVHPPVQKSAGGKPFVEQAFGTYDVRAIPPDARARTKRKGA